MSGKKPISKKGIVAICIGSVICGLFILFLVVRSIVDSAYIANGGAATLNDLSAGVNSESAYDSWYSNDSAPAAEAAAADEAYSDDYDYDSQMNEVASEDVGADGSTTSVPKITFDESRKLIYRSNVTLETLDYTKTYSDLLNLISKYDGYVESESFENDNGSYLNQHYDREGIMVYSRNDICIRIPRNNYFDFMEEGLSLGNVVSRNQSVEDKTADYATNQSYIDILNKKLEYYDSQLDKLDKELTNAIENDDTDKFEQILCDMEYMANMKASVESSLIPYKRNNEQIDADSSYATINMVLCEVKEYTKPIVEPEKETTFVDRLKEVCSTTWQHFLKNCEIFLFVIIRLLPTLLVLGILALIFRFVFWKKIKAARQRVKTPVNVVTPSVPTEVITPQESSESDSPDKD